MSKNIVIQESGVDIDLDDAAKLATTALGGGTCTWAPYDETRLAAEKTITENGVYAAATDNVYGWEQVFVNVQSVSGSLDSGDNWELGYVYGRPAITVEVST